MNTPALNPYAPVDQFPEIARNAIWESYQNTQAPIGLILPCALTAMTLAVQGVGNVERMPGLVSPLTLWLITIAESGERKTGAQEGYLAPFREFEAVQAEKFRVTEENTALVFKVWEAQERALLKEIVKLTKQDKDTHHLKMRLKNHYDEKPVLPRRFKMLYDDATTGAIKEGMGADWPSVGLISDEGASVLDGHAIRDLSFPNRAWGGATLSVERVNEAKIVIREPRLVLSLMNQPGPFLRFLQKRGAALKDTGFFARFLFSYPPSTQGHRYIVSPTQSWEHLPKFQRRITELLERNFDSNGEPVEKVTLKFSPEAQLHWIGYFNETESMCKPNGLFFCAREYAAKIAENMARLAAIFHIFEGNAGDISLDTLNRAYVVIKWFANNYLDIFHPVAPISPEQADALMLEEWIFSDMTKYGQLSIPKTRILKYGPNSLRNAARLTAALDTLYCVGKIQLRRQGKRVFVHFTDQYWAIRQNAHQAVPVRTP